MSTGKRIAKRSIIGTRVVAPGIDGRFYPATIQSTKHYETFQQDSQRYLVKFDNSRKVCEFGETELVGPGFAGVSAIGTLMNGQRVYLTHGGREMEGTVLHHDERADIVTVNLASGEQVTVRRDEIRLLESRKSNRLLVRQTSASDLNKSAEFSVFQDRSKQGTRRRLNSEISSNSDSSEIFSSRKRRGSETVSEEGSSSEESLKRGSTTSRRRTMRGGGGGREEERNSSSPIMSECTAAMVLMDLYGSPINRSSHISGQSDASSGQMSPSSSGVSSLGSSWNSPAPLTPPFSLPSDSPVSALLELSGDYNMEKHSDSDEGIVSDQSFEFEEKRKKTEGLRTIYQCTWRSCHQETQSRTEIERHVRQVHLGLPGEPGDDEDGEEEFYYTEFELPPDSTEYAELAATPTSSRGASAVPELRTPVPSEDQDVVETEDCCLVVKEDGEMVKSYSTPVAVATTTMMQSQQQQTAVVSVGTAGPPPPHMRMGPLDNGPGIRNGGVVPSSPVAGLPGGGFYAVSPPPPPQAAGVAGGHQSLPSSLVAAQAHQQHKVQPIQPQPLLADHFDMARPPHENPEYSKPGCTRILTSTATPTYATIISPATTLGGLPIAIPITTFTISNGTAAGVPGKYIRLSPKPTSTPTLISSSPKSPVRRPRGDAKKCRKVYGMDQKDLWCTQCKWKKACTRFGESHPM